MWIEEFSIENIKCFEKITLKLTDKGVPYKWVTFLSENGCGKSTILQSLGLLMAGPDGVGSLLPRPTGWLREEDKPGKISVKLHQGANDPGEYGDKKIRRVFGYSYHVTGGKQLSIRNKIYSAPGIHESPERSLSWLRQNAFTSEGHGWFATGYGAFRRLTRSEQIIVPTLEPQARHNNFLTQFQEDEPLAVFERWMIYLDYRIAKSGDEGARDTMDFGVRAIDSLMPDGVRFHSISSEGRIFYNVGGVTVPTVSLSDGYRSMLALAGDLIWRLLLAYPKSKNPMLEEGVVLIDELDIHLHPVWQRDIPLKLRTVFPNLQFIVTTHSPLVAAGAGADALTIKINRNEEDTTFEKVENIYKYSVDKILTTEAFGLVSAYSPQTNEKMDTYTTLFTKKHKTKEEGEYLAGMQSEIKDIMDSNNLESDLDRKVNSFIEGFINDQA